MSHPVRQKLGTQPLDFVSLDLDAFPRKADFYELGTVLTRALAEWPPPNALEIFGPPVDWVPPHRRLSEFNILDPWRPRRTLGFLAAAAVPSFHRKPPPLLEALLPPVANRVLFRPTRFFVQPDPYGSPCPHHGEAWFFINGVVTTRAVAEMNAALLAEIFRRPITVIHNSTNSLLVDLMQCAFGKEFKDDPEPLERGTFTEPALEATIAILDALNRPDLDRVVVLAHSQGTIIAANVLRAVTKALEAAKGGGPELADDGGARWVAESLTHRVGPRLYGLRRRLTDSLSTFIADAGGAVAVDRLAKLEIYTFANCADRMRHVVRWRRRPLPYLEHFANRHDLVARLGVLSPYLNGRKGLVEIDGPIYVREGEGPLRRGAWGHLLNEHYLFGMVDYLSERERRVATTDPYPALAGAASAEPRLYSYFQGRTPGPTG